MPSKRSLNPNEQHELWLAYRRRSFGSERHPDWPSWYFGHSDMYPRWREWIKGWRVPSTTKLRNAPKQRS